MGTIRLRHRSSWLLAVLMVCVLVWLPAGQAEASDQGHLLKSTTIQAEDADTLVNESENLVLSYKDGAFRIAQNGDVDSAITINSAKTITFAKDNGLFSDASQIERIEVVGKDITTIARNSFRAANDGLVNLKTLDLSQSGVIEILGNVCQNCSNFEGVIWPTGNAETQIHYTAFSGCSKYDTIIWPENAGKLLIKGVSPTGTVPTSQPYVQLGSEKLPLSGFCECGWFELSEDGTTVTISRGNVGLGNSMIFNKIESIEGASRENVKKVVLEDGVIGLASVLGDFDGFTALESISFPSTFVNPICTHTFRGCTSLKELDLSNTQIEIINADIMQNSGVETLKLPNTLKSATDAAFGNCPLKSVVFPEDSVLETIGNAFQATAIEEIELPNSVKTIGASAFAVCPNLKSVSLPASIESVDTNAFQSSNTFLSDGEIIVRDWCGVPEALKGKSFTSIVKPALAHDFSKYAAVDVQGADDIMLQHKCGVCGGLDPDDQPTALTEIIKTAEDGAVEEAARAACAEAKIDYNDSLSAAENAAAATAKVAGDAVAAAKEQAAKDQEAAVTAAVKASEDKAAKDKAKAVKAAKAQGVAEGKAAAESTALKANTMTAKAKIVKAKSTKKTTIKKAKAFEVKNAKGKVTFYKVSGSDKITVTKAGMVKVKKGLKAKKKPYKVKVLVCAAGNKSYAPAYKIVTLKVKVS